MALQIKKFQAPTLQEAIEQIRLEMGDDAIILQTDPVKTRGVFTKNKIEVTAAIDREEAPARFHATVTETAAERGEDDKPNEKAWGTWLSSAAKGLKRAKPKAAPAPSLPTKTTPQSATPAVITTSSQEAEKPSMGQIYAMKTFIEPMKQELAELKAQMSKATKPKAKFKDPLEEEVSRLRQELRGFIAERRFDGTHLPAYLKQLMNFWKDKGLTDKQVLGILQQMESWGYKLDESVAQSTLIEGVQQLLSGSIQEANVLAKNDKRIVVLVGPTGVGKTTTIAKMAAQEKLRLKRSVAMITVDDFKIGGTDQLAHYARILDVPFAKPRSDMTLEEQCRLLNVQTIFVDTFGLSLRDTDKLKALQKLLTFLDKTLAARLEIHLVLPVGISARDVTDSIQTYLPLKPQFLVFTKWDETNHWGGMLAAILSCRLPVSFISHGQSVPDDFAMFSKESFIETVTSINGETI